MSAPRNMRAEVTDRTRLVNVEDVAGRLLVGHSLTCPACEKQQDLLAFTTFRTSQKYSGQVLPVLKCRLCRHVFALVP